ncbi:MAG: hypothetical protein JWP61_2548 [Friedmanniella sp.]|nr:hypothetical protein [Friedmanniella sp.]
MVLPTAEALEERRRGYRRRAPVCAAAALFMLLSATLPHVGILAFDDYGRNLIAASRFFIKAQAAAEGFQGANPSQVALGLNVTYGGLAAQQVGLLFGVGSFWVLAAASMGRWTRRLTLISGWLLLASVVLTTAGFGLLEGAGVPSRIGVAWLFALFAGLTMVLGGRAARAREDQTTYLARPMLNG